MEWIDLASLVCRPLHKEKKTFLFFNYGVVGYKFCLRQPTAINLIPFLPQLISQIKHIFSISLSQANSLFSFWVGPRKKSELACGVWGSAPFLFSQRLVFLPFICWMKEENNRAKREKRKESGARAPAAIERGGREKKINLFSFWWS